MIWKRSKKFKKYKKLIEESGLFDEQYYLNCYEDARAAKEAPLEHFLMYGIDENRNPNDWFDAAFYLEQYPDVKKSGLNPFVHYLLHGKEEGRICHPRELEASQSDEPAELEKQSLGREWSQEEIEAFWTIEKSGLFDAEWYLENYPEAKEDERGPLNYYIEIGQYRGDNPNDLFDTAFYLEQYPDVKEGGMNPFVHYLLYGKEEGRICHPRELEAPQSDESAEVEKQPLGREWSQEEIEAFWTIEKSGLFDGEWYLENYPEAKADERGPLNYYIEIGQYRGDNPNDWFDAAFYLEQYPDVKKSGLNPFVHYLLHGKEEGRICHPQKVQSVEDRSLKFGPILHNPLVSLIAVNYNGANDLPAFLRSVSRQSYRNFELIIVDNNSTDNSERIIEEHRHLFKKLVFVQSGANLGFAAGNNYALPYCKGELLCLINVDTVVDKEWLKEAVDAMSVDGDCAIVASKTLFFERFQDLELNYVDEFSLDLDLLIGSLSYKKYFVRQGNIDGKSLRSSDNRIIISLPVQEEPIKISCKFGGSSDASYLTYKIGKNSTEYVNPDRETLTLDLDFSQESVINSSYIINNAGSILKDGMPADRGFGEYDIGQYDSRSYVDFVCGVSALIRRSAIVNRKIFVSEFFAYYEDSELSRWVIDQGHKILYAPRSVLYHQHSATSSEGSPLWNLLVTRSRNIYKYEGDYDDLFHTNNHLEIYFKQEVPESVHHTLKQFSKELCDRLQKENDIVERLKPIGIYNSYWMTKGGGESHALAFASILQRYETVYLISEQDFDIDELAEYYHLDLSNCRKIVENNISRKFTEKFDIFINSTYRSNLGSNARKSYYIVSFPHKDVDLRILKDYTFLYNSDYTKRWAHCYWGEGLKEEIVYPIGMIDQYRIEPSKLKKEKIVLSVGRFFVGGHSKNQHIIAKAFRALDKKFGGEWKLVLIGSLNLNSTQDVGYVDTIRKELEGTNHRIVLNASRGELNSYFSRASIYVHASGFGNDPEKEPNRFEHFGITPVEAMVHGCYPIVYEVGGPADLTRKIHLGDRFSTLDQLVYWMNYRMSRFEDDQKENVISGIRRFLEENNFKDKIKNLMEIQK